MEDSRRPVPTHGLSILQLRGSRRCDPRPQVLEYITHPRVLLSVGTGRGQALRWSRLEQLLPPRQHPEYPAWRGTPYIPSHLDTLDAPPGSLKQKIHENSTLGSMCLSCFLYKNNKFSSNSCSRKTCYAPRLVLLDKCHAHRALEQKMLRTEESSRTRQVGRLPSRG